MTESFEIKSKLWIVLTLRRKIGGAVLADHHRQEQGGNQQNAWKSGSEYKYQIRARTLAALHQVADQYSGVIMKGQLVVQPKSDGTLRAKISRPQYAQIHTELPGGWDTHIPEGKLSFKQLPMSGKPFEIKLKNGAIDDLMVDSSLPKWEVNVLKSVVSQLQVDVQGENQMDSTYNQEPEGGKAYATFKVMEDSVTGKCEVLYDISPLPDYILQTKPELAPLPQLRGDGQMIDVVKAKNFSHCHQNPTRSYGMEWLNDWEPGTNSNGHFFSKSSMSRIILSGTLDRHTIQSSVTTTKFVLSPELHNEQKGMVVSRLNLTLVAVGSASSSISSPSSVKSTGNLVYHYDSPASQSGLEGDEIDDSGSNSFDSSSSFSSSSYSESDSSSSSDSDEDSSSSSSSSDSDSNSSSSSSSSDSDSDCSSSSFSYEEQFKKRKPRSLRRDLDNDNRQGYDLEKSPQSGKGAEIESVVANVARKDLSKLAKQIAEELQRPSSIPKEHTLEKFNTLVQMVRALSAKEINQMHQSLYQPYDKTNSNSQSESVRRNAWVAFRDAVVAAGTGPALLSIKQWIKQKKLSDFEAAAAVASLPKAARYPTPAYIDAFFSLATDQQVVDQPFLNTSAILAFTELVRLTQASNSSAHYRYPVQNLAGLSPRDQSAVTRKYLPYLSQKLQSAISRADSPKILTYIRALGNLAHPQILAAFEPYLEGQKDASDFQRLSMVGAMDKLALMHPKVARSVLFKIYQNTGEAHEVRCAAVFQLMKTNPPASMLQRMAQFTNWDVNEQVNSAVKTAIESAAELDQEENSELAANARAAKDMLNPKIYGIHYSQGYLRDHIVEEMNLAYKLFTNSIGSQDSILPQAIFMRLKTSRGGYNDSPFEMGAMVSSINDLSNYISEQFSFGDDDKGRNQKQSRGKGRWSPENIAKMLNIESDDAEQLEGRFWFNSVGWQSHFAFDNHTLDQIPRMIRNAAQAAKEGKSFNRTEFSDNEIFLTMPTVTGFPFVYSVKKPTLFKIGGEVQARSKPDLTHGPSDELKIPSTTNVTTDIHFVYSTHIHARIQFITPFDYHSYEAGIVKNFQMNVPLRIHADFDAENQHIRVKLQPIQQDRDYNLFHYSTKPYTSKNDIRNISPVIHQDNTQPISTGEQIQNDYDFGKKATGMAFRLKSSSERRSRQPMCAWLQEQMAPHDAVSAFAFPFAQQVIEQARYDLVWDSRSSSSKSVVVTASWDSQRSDESGDRKDSSSGTPQPSSKKPDSQKRQDELQDQAASGINDADVASIDVGVAFQGQSDAQYAMTAAVASSNTDDTSRLLFYYYKKSANDKTYEVCMRAESEMPNVPEMDFTKALKADPKSKVEFAVNFGEQCQSGGSIEVKGKWEQSSELTDYLRQHPMAKQCAGQMEKGDYALPACRNMTARANHMDEAHFTIKYKNIPATAQNMTFSAYRAAQYFAFENAYENVVDPKDQEEGRIDVDLEFSNEFDSMNISINTPAMDANFTDIEITHFARPLFAVHPVHSAAQRLGRKAMYGQYNPQCVVDNNSANTFDNKTYPVELGKCWHVLMVTVPEEDPDNNNDDLDIPEDMQVTVIARDVSNDEKEIKITLGDDEITFSPSNSGPKVQVNGKQIEVSEDESYAEIDDEELDVDWEIFALPGGSVKLSSYEFGIEAVYDGSRVKISAAQKYRGSVRGLCGNFNGETSDEFTTPQNCVLKNPEEFSASWALTSEQCSGQALKNSQIARSAYCPRKMNLFGNVVSEQEAGRSKPRNSKFGGRRDETQRQSQRGSSRGQQQGRSSPFCYTHKTEVVRENGETCFSLRPVPTCASRCRPQGKREKAVQMHCVENSQAASKIADQVRDGHSHDFSRKSVSKTIRMSVPTSCSA
ncbi:vitellogenin isoform X1 [Neodiprion fabricii]|uniref:vitellogenin isoform X1 n=1 Tax=Neodiprion fabricii TaxID=2872261 RepID=UPI001ED8E21B|nr:vitellogenin isoform X1 [Neodiprion fabricii]